jgi:hypothetical protein
MAKPADFITRQPRMKSDLRMKQSPRLAVLAGVAVCMGALNGLAGIQPPPSDLMPARSLSGQFVAYTARAEALSPALSSLATNQAFVQLEPILVTVSCERIKQMLLRELNITAPWRGTIYLVLYPAQGEADTITIASERFRNGWQYRVDLPNVVARPRYVGAIVQVLLLELANRSAQEHAADIPRWLMEGFSQLLLASSEIEIILPPPRAGPNGLNVSATILDARRQTLVQQVQKKLGGHPPLTFEALSWPTEQDLADGAGGLIYRGSAQLFVGELLRLPDGRACLQTMLARLPQHRNWQFAFLEAFQSHFERPLDVEKWWALSIAQATGHYATSAWPPTESWQKLDQAIHAAVQIRLTMNELPLHSEVSLQKIILEWDPVRQTQALGNALRELGQLRQHVAQEYAGLVRDYCDVIETYLRQRDRSAANPSSAQQAAQRTPAEVALQQLDALDARRMALRPGATPAQASPSAASPASAP